MRYMYVFWYDKNASLLCIAINVVFLDSCNKLTHFNCIFSFFAKWHLKFARANMNIRVENNTSCFELYSWRWICLHQQKRHWLDINFLSLKNQHLNNFLSFRYQERVIFLKENSYVTHLSWSSQDALVFPILSYRHTILN